MKVSEMKSQPPKILIFGAAGTGKSALTLTLGADLQILDFDGNLDVGLGLHDNLRDQRLAVDVVDFQDTNAQGGAFQRAKQYVRTLVTACKNKKFEYKYLAIDSLTSLATSAIHQHMAGKGGIDKAPQIQDWGMILSEIENIVFLLRTLPIPIVFIAHEEEFVSTDVSKIRVAIPGQKLPPKIIRMFSEIWYTKIRAKGMGVHEFSIQTAPTDVVTCRSGKGLPTNLVYGTMGKDGLPKGDSLSLATILTQLTGKEI